MVAGSPCRKRHVRAGNFAMPISLMIFSATSLGTLPKKPSCKCLIRTLRRFCICLSVLLLAGFCKTLRVMFSASLSLRTTEDATTTERFRVRESTFVYSVTSSDLIDFVNFSIASLALESATRCPRARSSRTPTRTREMPDLSRETDFRRSRLVLFPAGLDFASPPLPPAAPEALPLPLPLPLPAAPAAASEELELSPSPFW